MGGVNLKENRVHGKEDNIAKLTNVSPFHLQRTFAILTEITVGDYSIKALRRHTGLPRVKCDRIRGKLQSITT